MQICCTGIKMRASAIRMLLETCTGKWGEEQLSEMFWRRANRGWVGCGRGKEEESRKQMSHQWRDHFLRRGRLGKAGEAC